MTTGRIILIAAGILLVLIIVFVGLGYMIDRNSAAETEEAKMKLAQDTVAKNQEIRQTDVKNGGRYERNTRNGEYTFIGKGPLGMDWVYISPDGTVHNPPVLNSKNEEKKENPPGKIIVVKNHITYPPTKTPPPYSQQDNNGLQKSYEYTNQEVGKVRTEMKEGFDDVDKSIDRTNEKIDRNHNTVMDAIESNRWNSPYQNQNSSDSPPEEKPPIQNINR